MAQETQYLFKVWVRDHEADLTVFLLATTRWEAIDKIYIMHKRTWWNNYDVSQPPRADYYAEKAKI